MLPKYNHTLCHLQQMEWINPQGYTFTDKYCRKQSLQNRIRHLYLKWSEMWHLILEWVKKFQFPKAGYRCWFDTHIKYLCFTVIWILTQTYKLLIQYLIYSRNTSTHTNTNVYAVNPPTHMFYQHALLYERGACY